MPNRVRQALLLFAVAALILLATGSGVHRAAGVTEPAIVDQIPLGLGFSPTGVTMNPGTGRIYVATNGGVSVVNAQSEEVLAPIFVAPSPSDAVFDPNNGRVYVPNADGVSVVDTVTETVVNTIPLDFGGRGEAALDAVHDRLYVNGCTGICVIDTTTETQIGTIERPVGRSVAGIDVNQDTQKIYVALGSWPFPVTEILVIDAVANSPLTTIPTSGGDVAVNAATNRIYATSQGGVVVIDGANDTVADTIPLPGVPFAIAVNPVTNIVYVGVSQDPNVGPGEVFAIDGATNAVVNVVPVPGNGVRDVYVNATDNLVVATFWGANTYPQGLSVIDGQANVAIKTFFTSAPTDVEVNPATNSAYVVDIGLEADWVIDAATNSPFDTLHFDTQWARGNIAVDRLTNRIYVATGTAVLVFDGDSNAQIGTIPIQAGAIVVDSTANRIYVTVGAPGCQQWCVAGLTVIDGGTNEVIAPVVWLSGSNARLAVNESTHLVYAATSRDTVDVIDGVTNTVITSIPVALGAGVHDVAVDTQRNRIYVGNRAAGTVSVIDGLSNTVIDTLAVGARDLLLLAVNPGQNHLYAASIAGVEGLLQVLDGDTGGSVAGFPIPLPTDLAVNPNTNRLYVANTSGALLVIQDGPLPVIDSDGDGVPDSSDSCIGSPVGESVDANGCADSQVDGDADGVCDPGSASGGPSACTGSDACPGTATGATVEANGCSQAQVDQDVDVICDYGTTSEFCNGSDSCLSTPLGTLVDARGCSQLQADQDLDSVCDVVGAGDWWCVGYDSCPNTPLDERPVDATGCSQHQVDQDLDGICDSGRFSTLCATLFEPSFTMPRVFAKPQEFKEVPLESLLDVISREWTGAGGRFEGDDCYFAAVTAVQLAVIEEIVSSRLKILAAQIAAAPFEVLGLWAAKPLQSLLLRTTAFLIQTFAAEHPNREVVLFVAKETLGYIVGRAIEADAAGRGIVKISGEIVKSLEDLFRSDGVISASLEKSNAGANVSLNVFYDGYTHFVTSVIQVTSDVDNCRGIYTVRYEVDRKGNAIDPQILDPNHGSVCSAFAQVCKP